ncbi:MAG TPA: glycoside hydrolase family 30 beta sandwich domain-containing protein [Glaciihabitans sp.]|nr:glycoside hydrolase family 30 beta sandwich domain-containing protein [Glaciihabitans sp.]
MVSACTPEPEPVETARIYTTSADRSRLLDKTTVEVNPPARADATVRVDLSQQRQQILGVGAALTESSAHLIGSLPETDRAALLTNLFRPSGGGGIRVLRIALGASDFVVGEAYTYADSPDARDDWGLEYFSLERDEREIIPVLREILALRPDLTIIASPWSAPAWMKDNRSLVGGALRDEDGVRDAYARYLLRAVQEYTEAGIPIAALTVQNEPQARTPDGYPGMDMPVEVATSVINRLAPLLREQGLGTLLLGFDHNWQLHPADVATTPSGRDPEYDYPFDLMTGDAGGELAGIAYHCYFGDPSAQQRFLNRFPHSTVWVTECSGSFGADDTDAQVFADTLRFQASTVLIGGFSFGATAVLTWNLALDAEGGPHRGGCERCTGVVTIDEDEVTHNAEFYALSHVFRFIRSGAVRVNSAITGADVVAFAAANTSGQAVVMATNTGESAQVVTVEVGGTTATHTMERGDVATFVFDR